MDAKLRDLEAMDIAVSVLSHGLPLGPDVLGGAEADDWAMRINDDLARIIAAYPGKFVGFGTIGFGNPQRAIAEVDRCITQLGFKGIQLFSNIAGKMLDAAEHRQVLQRRSIFSALSRPVDGASAVARAGRCRGSSATRPWPGPLAREAERPARRRRRRC